MRTFSAPSRRPAPAGRGEAPASACGAWRRRSSAGGLELRCVRIALSRVDVHPMPRAPSAFAGMALVAAGVAVVIAVAWPAGFLDNVYRAADHAATPWLVIVAGVALALVAKRRRSAPNDRT